MAFVSTGQRRANASSNSGGATESCSPQQHISQNRSCFASSSFLHPMHAIGFFSRQVCTTFAPFWNNVMAA